jgi:hypothetical protein
MVEADLIKKIQLLKNVEPRKEWVFLIKKEIFKEEISQNKFSQIVDFLPRMNYWKFLVPAMSFCLPFILLAVSQNALPGDALYSVKKLTEKTQSVFVSGTEKTNVQLGFVNKRLEELNQIVAADQKNKIAPAFKEYQASMSEAVKNLVATKNTDVSKIIQQTKNIEENKQKAEALGVKLSETDDGLNAALASLVDREIKDLESRNLNDGQQELLAEVKTAYQSGDYNLALEKILQATQSYK